MIDTMPVNRVRTDEHDGTPPAGVRTAPPVADGLRPSVLGGGETLARAARGPVIVMSHR